ncbi:fha domain [Stylonychia lemnae]|uniref:Fha domain n=1 Tax=Stylonychia lemnae TaxID=5949 RepID=A0A078AS78_STYLE|nr:fha domain [Stylonychia lemnae]|eukprot:CDW85034.1 fha domain [Stylonychia lemnae]
MTLVSIIHLEIYLKLTKHSRHFSLKVNKDQTIWMKRFKPNQNQKSTKLKVQSKQYQGQIQRRVIPFDAWYWDKELAHRLFNFHEGFKTQKKNGVIIGTSVLTNHDQLDVSIRRTSQHQDKPYLSYMGETNAELELFKSNRLLNIIYHDKQYYVAEQPQKPVEKTEAYDCNIWLMPRYMPKVILVFKFQREIEISEGDIIRMGRIPFKITKLVLTPPKEYDSSLITLQDQSDFTNMTVVNQSNDIDHSQDQMISQPDFSDVQSIGQNSSASNLQDQRGHLPKIRFTKYHSLVQFIRGGVNSSQDRRLGGVRESFQKLESGKACRICLDEIDTMENPLITPCKCSGLIPKEFSKNQMEFIHTTGRNWHASYVKRLSSLVRLCVLNNYLDNISLKNKTKKIYLLNYKQPKNKKFMVLDSDIDCLSKAIHVIVFSRKNDFYIGRRVNNDITISDISVSRSQSAIKLRDNKVYISDCDSKFGTFVKIQQPMQVPANYTLPVQTERKCYFMRLENRFTCIQSCLMSCRLLNPIETHDHFKEVYNKFSKELQDFFLKNEHSYAYNSPRQKDFQGNKKLIDDTILSFQTEIRINNQQNSGMVNKSVTSHVIDHQNSEVHPFSQQSSRINNNPVSEYYDNELGNQYSNRSPFSQINKRYGDRKLPPINKNHHHQMSNQLYTNNAFEEVKKGHRKSQFSTNINNQNSLDESSSISQSEQSYSKNLKKLKTQVTESNKILMNKPTNEQESNIQEFNSSIKNKNMFTENEKDFHNSFQMQNSEDSGSYDEEIEENDQEDEADDENEEQIHPDSKESLHQINNNILSDDEEILKLREKMNQMLQESVSESDNITKVIEIQDQMIGQFEDAPFERVQKFR